MLATLAGFEPGRRTDGHRPLEQELAGGSERDAVAGCEYAAAHFLAVDEHGADDFHAADRGSLAGLDEVAFAIAGDFGMDAGDIGEERYIDGPALQHGLPERDSRCGADEEAGDAVDPEEEALGKR